MGTSLLNNWQMAESLSAAQERKPEVGLIGQLWRKSHNVLWNSHG